MEAMKIMVTSFKRSHAATDALTTPDPAAGHQGHSPPLDGHVQVSLLWGHCSVLLGLGVHRVLFVSSKSLFPQSCVSSCGSMVELMSASSKRAYAIPRSAASRARTSAAGHCWPIPPQETLRHSSDSVSVG